MVDFNNESTIGTPAGDIVRVLILQARANIFEAWERYKRYDFSGSEAGLEVVRARIVTLFNEMQGSLKRKLKKEIYKEIYDKVYSANSELEIMDLIEFFNEELDKINLTRIDNKTQYDTSKVENENKVKNI